MQHKMNIRMKFSRFVKSYVTIDFRTTAIEQRIADIKRRAHRYETLRHTAGKVSVFA